MSLQLNVLEDRLVIVKEATTREVGLRIRQPVVREGRGEKIDLDSFLVEEFTTNGSAISTVKINSGNLPQFIEALKKLKGDRREKKRKLVEVVLIGK